MRFKAGDIIKVKAHDGRKVIGKALQTRDYAGFAYFSVLTSDGQVHKFNLNWDFAKVIYSDPFSQEKIEALGKAY